MNIGALVKYSKLFRWGLLALVAGLGLIGWGSLSQLPAEADLQTVGGKVEQATRVTTKRRRSGESVSYRFDVVDDKGGKLELTMPASEISEQQALQVLNAKSINAKFDSERDVYVIAADGRTLIDYDTTRRRRESSNASLVEFGLVAGGVGLLLLLAGWLWNRRALA